MGKLIFRWELAGIAFIYRPPRLFLFEDPRTHEYGILDSTVR